MPERLVCLASLLAALLFGAGCPAGETVLRVQGVVADRSAHPLENVAVALRADGRQPHLGTTDREGAFQLSIVGAPHATVTFSKEGFRSAEAAVDVNGPPLRIVLDPATAAP